MSHPFFIKLQGIKQGDFKGEVTDPNGLPAVQGVGFEQSIASPRDAASGQATGRRQYSPIVITKEWGAASPQLFQALVNNESLKTVQFDFYDSQPGAEGSRLWFTIKLSNAFVSKIEKYEHFNAAGHQDANDDRFLEDISFTFQKIEMVHQASSTTTTDTAQAVG